MRVSLFIPCFVDLFSPEVGMDTARVLRRLGHEVRYPDGQTCCGQPALTTGFFDQFDHLARRLLDILDDGDPEAVVCPSGSCVAALRAVGPHRTGLEHPLLDRLFELSEFLTVKLGVEDVGATFPARVTWHDSCHPLRELGIRDGPRALLQNVRGLELIEMERADECCGFGGAFSVKMPDASAGMGERKLDAVEATGAEYVASTESSCLMHLRGMLERRKSPIRPLHLATVLAGEDHG